MDDARQRASMGAMADEDSDTQSLYGALAVPAPSLGESSQTRETAQKETIDNDQENLFQDGRGLL